MFKHRYFCSPFLFQTNKQIHILSNSNNNLFSKAEWFLLFVQKATLKPALSSIFLLINSSN